MKYFLSRKFLLILIVALAAFLRFYQMGKYPPSLMVDEVSNGYNAYSILKTAKDEYGNVMPLSFKAFGDYNLALSVYTLVPSIGIFGLNEIGVRFPSAMFGTLTVMLTYFFVKKILSGKETNRTRGQATALSAAFFLAISPWHLQFSRYDHEANFMVFFVLLGVTLFFYSFKKLTLLIPSAISFGLALNTYHGAKIWIPLLLVSLAIIYRDQIIKFKKKLIIPAIIMFLFSLPILLNFNNSLIRGQSVGIFQSEEPFKTFVSGYLSHYAPNYLFIAGDSIGRHSVPGMGELYVFELPLVIAGLLFLVKNQTQHTKFLFTWLLLAAIPAAFATPTPHALRALTFIPIWSIITAFGLVYLYSSIKQKKLKLVAFSILALVASYNITTYFHLYYSHYPKLKAIDWSDGYKEMLQYVDSQKDNYTSIAISSYFGWPYIYTLFYTKYDPKLYQPESGDKTKFAKYEFFGPSWKKTKEGKALVVTPPWQGHPQKVLKQIYPTDGDLRFTISEEQ